MRLITPLVISLLASIASAIPQSLAGQVDWHNPLIGIPSSSPTIHQHQLVTFTQKNVLAALNVSNGGLLWRHQLEDSHSVYGVDRDVVVTVTSGERDIVRSFDLMSGYVLWERTLAISPASIVPNNKSVISFINGDILVLSHGHVLTRLSGGSGKVEWTYTDDMAAIEHISSHTHAHAHAKTILVYSLIQSFASPQVGYLALNAETGLPLSSTPTTTPLPANVQSEQDVLIDQHGQLVWVHAGNGEIKAIKVDQEGKVGKVVVLSSSLPKGTSLQDFVQTSTASSSSLPEHTITVSSHGTMQCTINGSTAWTREEGLASIKASTMVDLPERKVEETISVLDNEDFQVRTWRHLADLVNLPGYISQFIARFTSGSYKKSLSSTPLSPTTLFRDAFGFQKLAILVSGTGRVYAIDSAHGNIVWQTEVGRDVVDVVGVWNVRNGFELGEPVVAVVTVEKQGETEITTGYHLDAFTGLPLTTPTPLFPSRPLKTFPLPINHCKTHIQALAIVSPNLDVHFYPACDKIRSGFSEIVEKTYFHTLTDVGIQGYATYQLQDELITDRANLQFKTIPTWFIPLIPEERVSAFTSIGTGPIASYGRVLGDRTTLYTYLNPHLFAISTTHASTHLGIVRVLDTTSGEIIYHTRVEGINTDKGIQLAGEGGWLVFTYLERDQQGKASKGQRMVSLGLYEGHKEDQKTESLSSPLGRRGEVHVIVRSWMVPVNIKRLSITTSKYGITYRDLILITDTDQIMTIPHRMLDPRRPDTPSKRDKEEFLIPYQPGLFLDPKWTLSHIYNLLSPQEIMTYPTLLESTSTVLVWGLDLFGTRVTPSGTFDILSDEFNKVQLVLTILGLGVGIALAKPAVRSKMLKGRWY